jgi:phosphotriesterase-related protein
MHRRTFLQLASVSVASAAFVSKIGAASDVIQTGLQVMTVLGPIAPQAMGLTLTHEHLLADLRPQYEKIRNARPYDQDEVVKVVLPYLNRVRELGCKTFVDCTAVYLGRDAALLKRISKESGLQILTVTGNYAALGLRGLSPYVLTDTVDALAQRWIEEWKHGIEGTDVRPGLIKLGFDGGPLTDVEQKLIRAAAIAHLETGLTIGAHISGSSSFLRDQGIKSWSAESASRQIAILEEEGVDPSAWIWIHAQNEDDLSHQVSAAGRGAWISFDNIGSGDTIKQYVHRVVTLRNQGLLNKILVSQDAGWYWVGEPGGGKFRPYDALFTAFIPALRESGFSQSEVDTLLIRNPALCFPIQVRRKKR